MENTKQRSRSRLCIDCAQLIVALFVPLAIIGYTIMHNNTEISIAQENRFQDLKIADERHQQDIDLANDEQEEATLVRYFNSLGKLLETNEDLINETNIARFKSLTALAQLKSKRKVYLIRSLIENKLITMNKDQNPILDLSLADLTGLDLTDNMLVNDEIICTVFSQTTLTNSSFRGMALHGSSFQRSILINSDFSFSHNYARPCYDGNKLGVQFYKAILDNSTFNDANYEKANFQDSSLNGAQMRRFICMDCLFLKAEMNATDLSEAQFFTETILTPNFQSVNMSHTILYKTIFSNADFSQATLTMVNAIETVFNISRFSLTIFENNSFIRTIILNSSFDQANFKGSVWNQAKIIHSSFIQVDFTDVQFIDSECYYCIFNQTILINTNFTNSILDGSDFRRTNITYEQLSHARSIQNILLPNETRI